MGQGDGWSIVNAVTTESAIWDPAAAVVRPEVAAFIYYKSRLAEEARYSEWEALWTDDALYWIPMGEGQDPETTVSYVYDNRGRIKRRVAQLNTGARHSQVPPSKMRRIISNLEQIGSDERSVTVTSNFVLYEYRVEMATWAGRYIHRIETGPERLRLIEKTVHLVNAGGPVKTLAFLI
jgi:3-phenylpropionate/cinnamic acid dioxygenase small subunit